jgi:translation initiation factor IF-2
MNQETITLQDLNLVVAIIDTVVKRGAIEGNEMTVVGGVRDKIAKFVKENTKEVSEEQVSEKTKEE